MELHLVNAVRLPLFLSSSQVRRFAPVVLFLFCSVSSAIEIEELSVTEVDGEYTLRIASVIDAPADYVHDVITDYRHVYRINPTITDIEILPSDDDGVVRMRNVSEHWVGPFRFKIDWAGEIEEPGNGYIKVDTIPGYGSFESGSAIWEIRQVWGGTRVLHVSHLTPNFFIPPVIGDSIMIHKMEAVALETFKRIECHARIRLARDLENDPEYLQGLFNEQQDCIQSPGEEARIALEHQ